MDVRPARPEDVAAVLPLVAAICAQHHTWDPVRYDIVPGVEERYRNWLGQRSADPRSVFLVALESGRAAGFLVGTVEPNIPIYLTREYGFIHDLWVEPEFRRRGAARALVMAGLRRFAEFGVAQVRLETAAVNESARALFAACGFRVGTVDMIAELPRP